MLKRVVALVLFAAPSSGQSSDDPRLQVEAFVTGLVRPVGATFVAPGELLIVQNTDGKVLRVLDGVPQNVSLDLTVSFQGARGIVADPDVSSNGYVYLYYGASSVADGGAWEESRVMRFTFDGTNLINPTGPLFVVPFDAGQSNVDAYNAGLLRFGPDGMLYGQVGDKARGRSMNGRIEQNTDGTTAASSGGIFRIAPDGGIPVDNPFAGLADPALHPWFVYGFRNSLGLDFDPESGSLWFSDNSVADYDEINRGDAGMNSGWMLIMGPDSRDATYDLNGNTAWDAGDLVLLPGAFYRDPELSYKDAIGVTFVTFLASRRFPEDLRDDLIVGESNLGYLFRYDLAADRMSLDLTGGQADGVADDATERDTSRLASGFGTTTEAIVGPDGWLYVVSWGQNTVYRIRPVVDEVEPAGLSVPAGVHTAGELEDLYDVDGARVHLDAGTSDWSQLCALEADFTLNPGTPTRIDVDAQARAVRGAGVLGLQVLHVPTGDWHVVARGRSSPGDVTLEALDLALPEEYVEPTTRLVRVRVLLRSPRRPVAPLGVTPPPSGPLELAVDRIRVRATLP